MATGQQKKVDLRSALAYLMVKWKVILLLTLACAILASAFGYYRKTRKTVSAPVSYTQKLENAKKALTKEDAAFTEQVYSQYMTYYNRLDNWNTYLKESVLQSLDPYSYTRLILQYAVQSDNTDVINAFSTSFLSGEDYSRIASDIGLAPEKAPYISELIYVTSAAAGSSTVLTQTDGTVNELPAQGSVLADGYNGVMNITVLAAEEAQTRAMEKVIDAAVRQKTDGMVKGGTAVTIRKIGSAATYNDAKILLNRQQTAFLPMVTTQTNRSNFVKNTVDTMSEAQKTYFQLMCEEHDEEQNAGTKKPAKKIRLGKYVAAGAAGGFLLSVLLLYIMFAFSGVIRTSVELTDNFGLSVLHRFRIGQSGGTLGKADVIRSRGLEILGGDAREADGAAPLAAELLRMMKNAEVKRLCIACDCDRENVRAVMQDLRQNLLKLSDKEIRVDLGSPMEKEADYQSLLEDDAVVIAETLSSSRKETLGRLIETCRRNEIRILGCATVMDDRTM